MYHCSAGRATQVQTVNTVLTLKVVRSLGGIIFYFYFLKAKQNMKMVKYFVFNNDLFPLICFFIVVK